MNLQSLKLTLLSALMAVGLAGCPLEFDNDLDDPGDDRYDGGTSAADTDGSIENGGDNEPSACDEDPEACVTPPDPCELDPGACNPPPPPPPQGCMAECHAAVNALLNICLDTGTPPEACHAEAREARAACVEECDFGCEPVECEMACEAGFATGPDGCEICECADGPPQSDCRACHEEARRALQECAESGNDREACGEAFEAAMNACRDQCHEPPPPPDSCDHCLEQAEHAFEECLETEGDEEACEARLEQMLRRCERVCNEEPPEDLCDRCYMDVEQAFTDCMSSDADEADCETLISHMTEHCEQLCEDPEQPPPDSCEQCEMRVEHALEACLESGADEEACQARIEPMLERCERICEGPGVPEDPCEQCELEIDLAFDACLESGADEERCEARAEEMAERCEQVCEAPGPCDACLMQLEEAFDHCLDATGDEEICENNLEGLINECERLCDGDEPPEPPQNPCDACEMQLERAFDHCLEGTGDEDLCAERLAGLANHCERVCDGGGPPPPPEDPCEACAMELEMRFERCIDETGDEALCEEHLAGPMRRCERICEGEGPPPPPEDPCEACAMELDMRFEHCLEETGDEALCEARLAGLIQQCERVCEGDEPPHPPENQCEACEMQLQMQFERCVEETGDEDACEQHLGGLARQCERVCDGGDEPPHPPENECEACEMQLEMSFERCLDETGDEDACHEHLRGLAEHCERICNGEEPPPEDACDACEWELETLFDQCIDETDDEAFCERELEDLGRRCARLCDGDEPPPPPENACEACEMQLDARFNQCVDETGDEAMCEQHLVGMIQQCARVCGGDEPPPPPENACDACEMDLDRAFEDCLDATGNEDLCEDQLEQMADHCEDICDQD